ncbi:flagellar hook protein FlgK [Hyphomicrobium nitrativorans NL23]|uniref:Flagellar hook-associated protein 1 n=1 Tax=Hyphomicrobium nitrativorans NL23 TaxID=1029756 RepID=V5SCJ4_9HYPH|nr:flagellar hook-associated protein FlgK [Hyphomicrobium nitrativorans]AHB47745.1 flagellar hook protein FlgK [Hyphomicrobium nitrativorans NL23]
MSLSASLSTANSSLFVTGERTSIVSRNIANADRPFYSKKSVSVVTVPGSGVKSSQVIRAEQPVLFRKVLTSSAAAATQGARLDALNFLNGTINDVELGGSPSALMNSFSNALQTFSAQPHSKLAAEAAVRSARDLADGLNGAASIIQQVRNESETGIQASVNRVNSLLADFKTVNDTIVKGTISGSDVTDYLDQRDEILANLSNEIGIRTVARDNNDMAIYTDGGVTLFDRSPRSVEFQRTLNLTPGVPGNAVIIDGVAVTGANATMPLQSGRLIGLVEARDDISLTYQAQLDEMARVLITAFAESDQSGGGGPDQTGLFTWPGSPAVPPAGTLISGLSGSIRVNSAVDPDLGGDAVLLRDGGINGADYRYNGLAEASFTDRIDELIGNMSETYAFDPAAKLAAGTSVTGFAGASAAWLQEARKVADDAYSYQSTLLQRSYESFSNLTGVNLEEELALMLDLERSFQTSSKLVGVIDTMFTSLLAAIR